MDLPRMPERAGLHTVHTYGARARQAPRGLRSRVAAHGHQDDFA